MQAGVNGASKRVAPVAGLAAMVLVIWLLAVVPAAALPANRLRITIPSPARAGSTYDVVITGSASGPATAYLFVDYAGCARSPAAERRRSRTRPESYRVNGAFAEVSGWRSSSTAVDHACGYLVGAGGHLLASARRAYRVG